MYVLILCIGTRGKRIWISNKSYYFCTFHRMFLGYSRRDLVFLLCSNSIKNTVFSIPNKSWSREVKKLHYCVLDLQQSVIVRLQTSSNKQTAFAPIYLNNIAKYNFKINCDF